MTMVMLPDDAHQFNTRLPTLSTEHSKLNTHNSTLKQ